MNDTAIRLNRSVVCRVAGAALLQPVLALLSVMLPIALVVQLARPHGSTLPLAVATPVVLMVWLAGVTAHAAADDVGVRWRYYLPHDFAWTDIERISLVVTNVGWGLRHSIVVRAGGRNHRITPAAAPGRGRIDFARQLFAYADANRIPAVDEGWGRV